MSPFLLPCLGLLGLATGMRSRHKEALLLQEKLKGMIFPAERGWETMGITSGMRDGMKFDDANGRILNVGGVCAWTRPHSGAVSTFLCEDGTYVKDGKCMKGGHGQRKQCPSNYPEMCKAKTCGGGLDYCCYRNCAARKGGLRDATGCEADALDIKERYVNMIKDPEEDRWMPFSQPRLKRAVAGKWANLTVVVAVTEELVDRNTIRPCVDNTNWTDKDGDTCASYAEKKYCTANGLEGEGWKGASVLLELDHASFVDADSVAANEACCACGGGFYKDPFSHLPTPAPTPAPTPEPTPQTTPETMPEPTAPEAVAPVPGQEPATDAKDDKDGATQASALFAATLAALSCTVFLG